MPKLDALDSAGNPQVGELGMPFSAVPDLDRHSTEVVALLDRLDNRLKRGIRINAEREVLEAVRQALVEHRSRPGTLDLELLELRALPDRGSTLMSTTCRKAERLERGTVLGDEIVEHIWRRLTSKVEHPESAGGVVQKPTHKLDGRRELEVRAKFPKGAWEWLHGVAW